MLECEVHEDKNNVFAIYYQNPHKMPNTQVLNSTCWIVKNKKSVFVTYLVIGKSENLVMCLLVLCISPVN